MASGVLLFGHTLALLIASYITVAALAILGYELVRVMVKRTLNRRLEKNLREFFESPDLYRQRFKFTNKLVIKHQLLGDAVLNEMILDEARKNKEDLERVRKRVESYIEEIVPAFNLFAYYRIGYPLARMVTGSLYDSVVDQQRRHVIENLGDDAAPVFTMNHRSNFDYVLLAYVLAGKASISYAVGEWARVWPLEHLFKAFGSYFVRRGYKEPLYHKILERYVQLIAQNGVTQAIFPEGGLSRDGLMRPPRLGLITWLAQLEADRDFDRNLVFVPIGVNYDRVLEDRHLVREARGIRKETGFWKKFVVLVIAPFTILTILVTNGTRFLIGQRKLHGHASISFGEPIHLKKWMADKGVKFGECTSEERRRLVEAFGDDLQDQIASAVPATPVTLLAVTLLDHGERRWRFTELVQATNETRAELRRRDVRIVTGAAFARFRHALVAHDSEPSVSAPLKKRPGELRDIDLAFTDQEETEEYVRFALRLLRRNRIVTKRGGQWQVRPKRQDLLRYYANSLAHHLGRSWPIPLAGGRPRTADKASDPKQKKQKTQSAPAEHSPARTG